MAGTSAGAKKGWAGRSRKGNTSPKAQRIIYMSKSPKGIASNMRMAGSMSEGPKGRAVMRKESKMALKIRKRARG
jgi:hypothetical protein